MTRTSIWFSTAALFFAVTSTASAGAIVTPDEGSVVTSDASLANATLTELISGELNSTGIEEMPRSEAIPNVTSAAEVPFYLSFRIPFLFPSGHSVFSPQVSVFNGECYWRTGPRPIPAQ